MRLDAPLAVLASDMVDEEIGRLMEIHAPREAIDALVERAGGRLIFGTAVISAAQIVAWVLLTVGIVGLLQPSLHLPFAWVLVGIFTAIPTHIGGNWARSWWTLKVAMRLHCLRPVSAA